MNNKDIENYWFETSPAFSNQYATFLGMPVTPTGIYLQLRYKKISKFLKQFKGKKMLDVGCGSGIFLIEGLKQERQVVGIDYSKQMLETARQNLSSFPTHSYQLLQASAQKMPLKSNSVDIVIASGLTDYLNFKDTLKFMSEVNRVLKTNGYAIITFPKKDSPLSFLRQGWGLYIRKLFLRLPPMQTTYTQQDIEDICKSVGINPFKWDEVLFTMRIMVGKKK